MTVPSNPKHFKSEFADRSPKHDEMHLWLSDKETQKNLALHCYARVPKPRGKYRDFVFEDIIKYEIEKPVYGYNRYLLGIIDVLIGFTITNGASRESYQCHACSRIISGEPDQYKIDCKQCGLRSAEPLRKTGVLFLLCEFKPELKSVGSTLAQIKVYKDALYYAGEEYRRTYGDLSPIIPVVITADSNYEKYVNLLMAQGVQLYYTAVS